MAKAGNGQGAVRKLSGKRNKPFQALVTVGMQMKGDKLVPKQKSLGCYATKTEARQACTEYIASHCSGDLTLAEAYEKVSQRESWGDSMQKSMDNAFKFVGAFHDKSMTEIKAPAISLIADNLNDCSASKQNNVKHVLKLCFDYAIENDVVLKNYADYMRFTSTKEKKEGKAYTADEVKKVSDDPIQKILIHTGMRISELWKADLHEIDGILCYDLRGKDVKNKSSQRIIPVHENILSEALSRPCEGISLTTYRGRYASKMKELKMDHTPHDCRRTFSTYAKTSGMDDFYRKAILGHKQGNITDDIYTTVQLRQLADQMAKYKVTN